MGVSNNALFFRENASNVSVIFVITFGVFGSMVPVFIVNAIAMFVSSVVMPLNEERTRKMLINYLQNHEKAMTQNKPKQNPKGDIILVHVEKVKKTKTAKGTKK